MKGGLFFPPISLENVGEAWSTFYTVTPSAINAWVGEEVRSTGLELTLARVSAENELSVKGAVFWNNDPAGSLLAYRGFALHDRQTGYRDRLPLPDIPSIEPAGTFEQQAPWVEPLFEIDGRHGYYGALAWESYRFFQLNALYFDNRGIPDRFDGRQYAWKTRFANVGAVVFLPRSRLTCTCVNRLPVARVLKTMEAWGMRKRLRPSLPSPPYRAFPSSASSQLAVLSAWM